MIEGKDLAVFALGSMVHPALKAVRKLSYYGIQAALINARFAAPLDVKTVVDWARKCGKIITVEENVLSGGFGSGILEVLEKENIKNVQVVRLGAPDAFVEHGPREKLLQLSGLDSDTIIATARKLCLAKVKGA
ncbi:MAG TPA: hypothetical protein GX697_01830 [Firmicutes bacterium]|nr:hypothetical protein [Bacillota bacterium]